MQCLLRSLHRYEKNNQTKADTANLRCSLVPEICIYWPPYNKQDRACRQKTIFKVTIFIKQYHI